MTNMIRVVSTPIILVIGVLMVPYFVHTHVTNYGLSPIQISTMAQHVQNSNIVREGPRLQTRPYSLLYTTRRLVSLYARVLQIIFKYAHLTFHHHAPQGDA